MTLSALDPITALIVIDLQKGIVSLPGVQSISEIIRHAAELTDAFRRHELPVILVNVTGTPGGRAEQSRPRGDFPAGWSELVPELKHQPTDHLVSKRTWGAFTHTDLLPYLTERQVTQVVIAGVSTSAGVESTARQAHEHGFHVTLAVDAMTDLNAESHTHSLTRIFPRLGESGTTRAIIELLDRTRG